ncbi:beta-microseminoprotein-like [Mixophyes fleayi]|uniref:beta-microseminoprotein-like n=1 Tax=Mixophyes fleayi TaxID=3061075 RepID=UPI003F4E26A3
MLQISGSSLMGCMLVVLLVSSFLALCNGSCSENKPRLSGIGIKPDGCMDGDIKRPLNSTWTKDCLTCTCDSEGIKSCCSILKPVPVDKLACEAILNKTTCKYEVKRKDNSSEPCQSWTSM